MMDYSTQAYDLLNEWSQYKHYRNHCSSKLDRAIDIEIEKCMADEAAVNIVGALLRRQTTDKEIADLIEKFSTRLTSYKDQMTIEILRNGH